MFYCVLQLILCTRLLVNVTVKAGHVEEELRLLYLTKQHEKVRKKPDPHEQWQACGIKCYTPVIA